MLEGSLTSILKIEQQHSYFFPGIARSIARIIKRSENRDLKAQAQHTFQVFVTRLCLRPAPLTALGLFILSQSVVDQQRRHADITWLSVSSLQKHRGAGPAVSLERLQELQRTMIPNPTGFNEMEEHHDGTQFVNSLIYAFGTLHRRTYRPRGKIQVRMTDSLPSYAQLMCISQVCPRRYSFERHSARPVGRQ